MKISVSFKIVYDNVLIQNASIGLPDTIKHLTSHHV